MVIREAGGYARITHLVKRIKQERNGKVLFLGNGDTIHGTFPAVRSNGEALVPVLNEMGIDAMTHHWEYAYGPDQVKRIEGMLDYPMLACNIYEEGSDHLVFPPYEVFERSLLKIGVIGVANRIISVTMPDRFSRGIHVTTGVEELPGFIKILREGGRVDLVVVLSHLGFPHACRMAEMVDGIDVILSGHTHNRLYSPVMINDTFIIQSGYQGSFIGRLDLELRSGRITGFKHELINIDDHMSEDETVKEEVEKVMEPHREMLEEVVGATKIPLARNRVLETTMDNFLLESLIHEMKADLAFSNRWRYGAPVERGPVTMEDLWNIIPVNPPISICTITGKELRSMMKENLEAAFSRDPFGQMGDYVKRCLGLNIYFKIENPRGHRIQDFFVRGIPLEGSKEYRACFVTSQGVPERCGHDRMDLDISAIGSLEDYPHSKEAIDPKIRGTVVAI